MNDDSLIQNLIYSFCFIPSVSGHRNSSWVLEGNLLSWVDYFTFGSDTERQFPYPRVITKQCHKGKESRKFIPQSCCRQCNATNYEIKQHRYKNGWWQSVSLTMYDRKWDDTEARIIIIQNTLKGGKLFPLCGQLLLQKTKLRKLKVFFFDVLTAILALTYHMFRILHQI